MGRSPHCDDNGLKKGPWTPDEDRKLIQHIEMNGHGRWRDLPKLAGLNRCGKSCRLRWTNYLRPDIKRGKFSQGEEQTIIHLHSIIGNKWSAIAEHLPGRTDNEIKNFWNTCLKKKLIHMGIDPMTHQPRTDSFATLPQLMALAGLKDIVESRSWGDVAAMLQAEALKLAKLQCIQYLLQSSPVAVGTSVANCNLNSLGSITRKMKPKIDVSFCDNTTSLLPVINPEPQDYCRLEMVDKQALGCDANNDNNYPVFSALNNYNQLSRIPMVSTVSSVTSLNNSSSSNMDSCSTSSYDASAAADFWSEPFMNISEYI